MTTNQDKPNGPSFPDAVPVADDGAEAERGSSPFASGLWWLALLCVIFGAGLFFWQWSTRGPEIVVRFREGHGIKAESRLMHRGIEVGNVEGVEPTGDLAFVDVTIRLTQSAKALMREGSRFWIERPTLSFQGARGLDTILSGRYVAVEPGPTESKFCRSFQGLDEPLLNRTNVDAMEIVLEGTELNGLQVDAPVIYRGFPVGRVQSVGLSADGRWIQVRAAVEADYRNLVRTNSRFWNRSGFRIEVGLSGVDVDAESLAGIAAGGIEFATPDPPGEPVKAGCRFELASKAEDDWKAWQPRLLHGNQALEGFGELPIQERLTAAWKEEVLLGFRKSVSRKGWVLLLDDGSLIGPRDLLALPSSALAGTMRWEMRGKEWEPNDWTADDFEKASSTTASQATSTTGRGARGKLANAPSEPTRWPVQRIAEWKPSPKLAGMASHGDKATYPLWIVGDVPNRRLPIEWHQIDLSSGSPWKLAPSLGLTDDHHGAAVIDGLTGNLIGIVEVVGRSAGIASIPLRQNR